MVSLPRRWFMVYWTGICLKKEKDREQDIYIPGKVFSFEGKK
jgi:hypothetical protein